MKPEIEIVHHTATRRRVATFTGRLEDADLFGAYGVLLESPGYDHGADDLVDLSGVTHMGVTSAGLRRLMQMFAPSDELGERTRLAIVAPADVVYGVSRMYQIMRSDAPEEIAVFRSHAEAERWLDR